tara:strand:+ start:81 stop:920 length:840 start_codon:yes stop_codon:yes gene_type:complete
MVRKILISESQLQYLIEQIESNNSQFCKVSGDNAICQIELKFPDNIVLPYTPDGELLPELSEFITEIKTLIGKNFNPIQYYVTAGASSLPATIRLPEGYDDDVFKHGFGKGIEQKVGAKKTQVKNGNDYLAKVRRDNVGKILMRYLNSDIALGKSETKSKKYSLIEVKLVKDVEPTPPKDNWALFHVNRQYDGGPLLFVYYEGIDSKTAKPLPSIDFVEQMKKEGMVDDSVNPNKTGKELESYFKKLTKKDGHIKGDKLYNVLNTEIPSLKGKVNSSKI